MYRLVFADDESIVREGVSTKLEWGKNGFELAALCQNGCEALTAVERGGNDIVLSDICMPLMDGLALSRELSRRFPDIIILLLTGYDEFEYAQEALKYQVMELLLKPITAAELNAVLERVKTELDRRVAKKEEQQALLSKLEESLPLLKERFLYRLVSGQLPPAEVARRAAYLQWQDRNGWYLTVVIHIPLIWDEMAKITLTESARVLLGEADEVFFNREENLVLLIQGSGRDILEEKAMDIARRILRESTRLASAPVSIAVGEAVPSPAKLSRSYSAAHRTLEHLRLLGIPKVMSIRQVENRSALPFSESRNLARRLTESLRNASSQKVMEVIDGVFSEIEDRFLTPGAAQAFLSRLQFMLYDFADDMERGVDDERLNDILNRLNEPVPLSLPDAREYFRSIMTKIADFISIRKHSAIARRIERAKQVIEERFADPRFCLQDVCDEVFLSVSQFSSLFKDGTGMTFVEYLTDRRIKEAKRLLSTTDLLTYEIADRIGYSDPRYFTHVFRKVTGMTSSEFRASGGEVER